MVQEVAQDALVRIEAVAQLSPPPQADPVARLVAVTHMVRLHKILDALLALQETGRFDAAPALSRTLIELVINIDFLFTAPDMGLAARGFVCRSVLERLKPLPYFEERVEVPADKSSPSEDEMKAFIDSVRPLVRARGDADLALARAGLGEDQKRIDVLSDPATTAVLESWPAKIYERAKDSEPRLSLYKDWFARFSLTTHPNWVVMHEQDVSRPDDGASIVNSYPNPLDIIIPTTWSLAAAGKFARSVEGGGPYVEAIDAYLVFFTRAVGLVPFFPGMTDEELEELIEQAEAEGES